MMRPYVKSLKSLVNKYYYLTAWLPPTAWRFTEAAATTTTATVGWPL